MNKNKTKEILIEISRNSCYRNKHNDYARKINEKFKGKIEIIGDYTGYKNFVDARCIIHGEFRKKAGDIKRSKHACDKCAENIRRNKISDNLNTVIKKAKGIHKDLYSYKNTKVSKDFIYTIYCNKHKIFFDQNKKSHLQGHTACTCCKLDKQKKRNSTNLKIEVYDKKSFIEKARKIHNYKYDYSNVVYKGMFTKIDIHCKECKAFLCQTPNDHIHKKNGCAICAQKKNNEKLRLDKTEFYTRAIEIHRNKYNYDLSSFVDSKTKMKVYCKKHNEHFYITPGKLLSGQGCRECGKDNIRLNLEYIIKQSKKIFGSKYNYSNSQITYEDTKTYFTFYCKSCEVDVKQRVDEHLKGTCCRYCKGNIKDEEMFIKKAKEMHDDRYTYENVIYKNSDEKIIITCKVHGEFKQSPKIHLSGSGCQQCKSSFGEKEISKYLKSKNISYIHDKKYSLHCNVNNYDKDLRFDFFLPKFNLFIEYDGRQHFIAENFGSKKVSKMDRLKTEQERDRRKNEIVKQNKEFTLLRIHYKDFKIINEILDKKLVS